MSAMAGRRFIAVRSVPEVGPRRPIGSKVAPSERGKNSYQAPYRARWRCTARGYQSDTVSRSRSG
ncbi:Uncharacterised protein [Mycobacterium tuberculosis]|nr:Uncharacterised protein [Mycobacterium tuberculosis]